MITAPDDFEKGRLAWETDNPIEDYLPVSDEFMDGWFYAKFSDPDWIEENMLIDDLGDDDGREANAAP